MYKHIYTNKYQGMQFSVIQHKKTGKYYVCQDFFFGFKYLWDVEMHYEQCAIDLINPDMWSIHMWHCDYERKICFLGLL